MAQKLFDGGLLHQIVPVGVLQQANLIPMADKPADILQGSFGDGLQPPVGMRLTEAVQMVALFLKAATLQIRQIVNVIIIIEAVPIKMIAELSGIKPFSVSSSMPGRISPRLHMPETMKRKHWWNTPRGRFSGLRKDGKTRISSISGMH